MSNKRSKILQTFIKGKEVNSNTVLSACSLASSFSQLWSVSC